MTDDSTAPRFRPPGALTRRRAFCALALAGLAAAGARAEELAAAPVEGLMAPGPLPDVIEGAADAPATIVEYASLTCGHCADFEQGTWPALRSKYVDAGKAKRILREFPLDPLALVAFMLARCVPPSSRAALIETLFARQARWAFVAKPFEALRGEAAAAGMSGEAIAACLADQELYERVRAAGAAAQERFAVRSTPTFFVNGRRLASGRSLADFDRALGVSPQ